MTIEQIAKIVRARKASSFSDHPEGSYTFISKESGNRVRLTPIYGEFIWVIEEDCSSIGAGWVTLRPHNRDGFELEELNQAVRDQYRKTVAFYS